MNARKDKLKQQRKQLNSQLENAEFAAKRRTERKKLHGKQSEILFGLGNLIFGGAIIGGIFQESQAPFYLYVTGIIAFTVLMVWGFYLYKKSIKED